MKTTTTLGILAALLTFGSATANEIPKRPHLEIECSSEPLLNADPRGDGFAVIPEQIDQKPTIRDQISRGLVEPMIGVLSAPPKYVHWGYSTIDLGNQGRSVIVYANIDGMRPPLMTAEEPTKIECGEIPTFLLVDQGDGFVLVWHGYSYFAGVRRVKETDGSTTTDLAFARAEGYSRLVYDRNAAAYRLKWIPKA